MSPAERLRRALPRDGARPRLIPYLMAGYPDRDHTVPLVLAAQAAGAAAVELGLPHSDPLADGPTIQAAGQRSLEQGMTVALALEQASRARGSGLTVPLVCMSHLNPLLQFGLERFCERATECGVDGLVVPDLPLEEMEELSGSASAVGLGICAMVAPTTPDARVLLAASRTTGFLYCVSRTGVTGQGGAAEGPALLARVRTLTDTPLALGFGVRRKEQLDDLIGLADAVVVGTLLVEAVSGPDPAGALAEAVRGLIG